MPHECPTTAHGSAPHAVPGVFSEPIEAEPAPGCVPGGCLAGRRLVAVINREAGSVAAGAEGVDGDRLEAIFREAGAYPDVRIVEPSRISDELRSAAESGAEVVVVGGGDGSVNTAVKYLHGGPTLLGVLPLGTLNHFAQSLAMPPGLDDAVRALSRGTPRRVDIGEMCGRIFVNNASLGLYPEAVRLRERYRRQLGLSKYMAMSYAFLSLLRDLPAFELLIDKDGTRERIRTPFMFLGNNRYDPKFLSYARRESLTDGCLSIFYAHEVGVLGLMDIGLKLIFGKAKQAPAMETSEAVSLTVKSRMRRLRVALDGEVLTMSTPLHVRVLPKALNVLFPGDAS